VLALFFCEEAAGALLYKLPLKGLEVSKLYESAFLFDSFLALK
jgi:hypothetical protein